MLADRGRQARSERRAAAPTARRFAGSRASRCCHWQSELVCPSAVRGVARGDPTGPGAGALGFDLVKTAASAANYIKGSAGSVRHERRVALDLAFGVEAKHTCRQADGSVRSPAAAVVEQERAEGHDPV